MPATALGAALRRHWPEYLMEAAGLGAFMISAGLFATLLWHPGSPVGAAVDPLSRRALMGVAMGLTAIGLIYSPWGRQSGAHLNPAVTLTFLRLGKVEPADALFYVLAQCAGGVAGVLLVTAVLGERFTLPPVSSIATVPGMAGAGAAFAAEALMAFVLMLTVLATTNSGQLMRFTGVFAGGLVALFITAATPISGMSINPARSFASALPSGLWTAAWIYFTAPPLGMLLAAEFYRRIGRFAPVRCAKLNHHTERRCIFRCGYAALERPAAAPHPGAALALGGHHDR